MIYNIYKLIIKIIYNIYKYMEISDSLISYFLTLPDEVLLTEIFPRFPIVVISRLCLVNYRFNQICNNDILWQIKTLNKYYMYKSLKPLTVSWKNYYLFLSVGEKIPVYYHGDRIDYVNFGSKYLNMTIALLVPLINQITDKNINIVFIDQQINPIIIVKYPDMIIDIKSTNYETIQKVIIFVDEEFNIPIIKNEDINNRSKYRGRREGVRQNRLEIKNEVDINVLNKRAIISELTSPFGNPQYIYFMI